MAIGAAALAAYTIRWGGEGDTSVGSSIRLGVAEVAFWWNLVATAATALIGYGLGRTDQGPDRSFRI